MAQLLSKELKNKNLRKEFLTLLMFMMTFLCVNEIMSQNQKIANEIQARQTKFVSLDARNLLTTVPDLNVRLVNVESTVSDGVFYRMNPSEISLLRAEKPEVMVTEVEIPGGQKLRLQLYKADAVSASFKVVAASNPALDFPYEQGLYYWGIVEGDMSSLVAISIMQEEIMGFIQTPTQHYTLGRLEGQTQHLHILYATEDLRVTPDISCHTDDDEHFIGTNHESNGRAAGNCVKMYVEVDYDIVVGKGGVQQAGDYVMGAFSQVAIMYANESIEFVVNEMKVWDVQDPYTGPSTSNYLTQFRNYLNGNYNGDLAHLVGYSGGGGIAYLDVLCNGYYGVAYSAVNSSYQNVPTYSWTIMVLTHEIGHNLGSSHTHACKWNGNNTAIDGCGAQVGYSEGCTGPIPAKGTVMSYCHLISGVGIDLNLGFGPQPGNLIRSRVNNAPCLSSCGPAILNDAGITSIIAPTGLPCENNLQPIVRLTNFGENTLTSVTIHYQLDNNPAITYAWTGSLAKGAFQNVTLPSITYSPGVHTFQSWTSNPNGLQDENPANDQSNSTFEYIVDYCVCNQDIAQMQPNPLTHTGGGSSNATVSFAPGSKNASFTITGLNSKINGPQQNRFEERVTVTYTDGNGNNQTVGVYLGSQQSSVSVSITGFVNAIQVNLTNGLNNNYSGTLSISCSNIDFCNGNPPCADDDGDGVCNEDDICPSLDNLLIGTACDDENPCTLNDIYTVNCICEGTLDPNCVEIECFTELISNFNVNPLTHQGAGSSSTTIVFPPLNANVSFVVSNMDSKLNGSPSQRYDDRVTITYTDGNGTTQLYGSFLGSQISTLNVNISGYVQSVTVALENAQNTNVLVSVSMGQVTSCLPQGEPIGQSSSDGLQSDVMVYPNPSNGDLYLQFREAPEQAIVRLYNIQGMLIGQYQTSGSTTMVLDLRTLALHNQTLIVTVQQDRNAPVAYPVILID